MLPSANHTRGGRPAPAVCRCCVLFKYGRRGEFSSPERFGPGTHVLADSGDGLDLGVV
eukprot:gene51609-52226_t